MIGLTNSFWSRTLYGKDEDEITEYRHRYGRDKVDVLDKIKAEVESIERYATNNGHDIWLRTPEEIKKEVLTIIDKYKAESAVKK